MPTDIPPPSPADLSRSAEADLALCEAEAARPRWISPQNFVTKQKFDDGVWRLWSLEAGPTWIRRAANAERLVGLFVDGWTVEKTTLYDEEGVEGWRWWTPDTGQQDIIGSWDELPPLPEDLEG